MNLLLDTHVFLWFVWGDPRISSAARLAIEDSRNTKYLSLVTPWEIAIKVGIGKIKLVDPVDVLVPREITLGGFKLLAITLDHVLRVATLPQHHRDPFDRLLVAQAMAEGMPILSADPALDAYPIIRLW